MKLDEELLEPVARHFRFGHGLSYIDKTKPVTIADLGCGPKMRLYHAAKKNGISLARYFGVDPLLDDAVLGEYTDVKDIELVKKPMEKQIPLPDNSVDYCVAFAFLEHIDFPDEILNDSLRVVRPGGSVIMTTPSYKSKPVLEFLSFKLGIISPREIEEHKNYFDGPRLKKMIEPSQEQCQKIHHAYFELGMNNLLVLTKREA
jgi:ubiquinone/menaquinone biosynthesis C-methylase UbiE